MYKIKFLIIIGVVISLLTSCSEKLDVENPNNQTAEAFWKTESDIAEGVIAIYNRLITDGCYARMTPSLSDVRGDDVWSESPWTIYPLAGDFTVLNDYDVLTWMWREYFMMVYRANQVLVHIDDVEFENIEYKNRLLGQTYFLRAFAYMYLTENYETIPIITKLPMNSDLSSLYPESSTREEVLAFILKDLTEAAILLPVSYKTVKGADKGQIGRATKGAALGLLSRVYMIQEDWGLARGVLEEIMGLGYELVDNYADNFTYSNENNSESIFEVQFGNFGTDENWWSYSTTNWRQGSGIGFNYGLTAFKAWGDMKPTRWLYDEFKLERTIDGTLDERLYSTIVSYEAEYDTLSDGRSNTIFGTTPYSNGTYKNQDTIFLAKWTYARINGHTAESDGVRLSSIINQRVIRFAEILLSYAEVLYELGLYDDAYAPLNEIRARVNLATLTPGSLSQADLYEEIIHQRVLELSVEGIRIYDLKRWGWFYDSNRLSQLIAHDDEFETWVAGHEYFPIPSSELDRNSNLGKNIAN